MSVGHKQVRLWVSMTSILLLLAACASVQKTPGGGLTSAVAQNVVRIACFRALEDADFSAIKGRPAKITLTGFADEGNSGILRLLFKTTAEKAGVLFTPTRAPEYEIEVAALAAGNDQGRASNIISRSERVEGTVDVEMTIRRLSDGAVLERQSLKGKSRYQQTKTLGILGRGKYYVRNSAGRYVLVADPTELQ